MADKLSKGEFIQMASRCLADIKELRARVAYLEPKAKAYDDLSQLLSLLPDRTTRTMAEDIVWRLEKRIAELQAPPSEDEQMEDSNNG